MVLRNLKGWMEGVVKFANLKIDRRNWKRQAQNVFEWPMAMELWEKDPDFRKPTRVEILQKRMKRYLSLVAEPKSRGKPPIAPWNLDDILNDVEAYSMEEGLPYFIRVVRESDGMFEDLKQAKIVNWENERIRTVKFPTYTSLKQYLYTHLAEAIESGEILKVARCQYQDCRKYILAKKKGRKYCDVKCRVNQYNLGQEVIQNYSSSRKEEGSEQEEQSRKLGEMKNFKKLLMEMGQENRWTIVKRLPNRWSTYDKWKNDLNHGASLDKIWESVPNNIKKIFSKEL